MNSAATPRAAWVKPLMMAAPSRPDTFVYVEPEAGSVFLWESWLRHEVMPNAGKGERISISFNYR